MHTLLVVDDEFGVADVLVGALEDEGYRVLTAANGRQGLERLGERHVDLVITDYMMPLMDGAALMREMRKRPDYADTPVLVMSAVREASIAEHMDGYAAFLRKPFPAATLVDLVARVLKRAE